MEIAKISFFSNGSVSGNHTDKLAPHLATQVSKFSPVGYYATDFGSAFAGPAGSVINPPYAVAIGKPVPAPLPPPLMWSEAVRPCNENFETRKRRGEIVMSDMFAISGLINVDVPGVVDKKLSEGVVAYRDVSLKFIDGFVPFSGSSPWDDYKNPWGGYMHGLPTAFYQWYSRTYLNIDQYPVDRIKSTVMSQFNTAIDSSIVQSVLAEANQGTMDMLTYMAELPETYRWLLDIFKKCRSTVVDFRQRNFALNEATARRQKSLRDRISVLHDLLQRETLSPAQKAKLQRDMKKLNQDLTYSIVELGNKVSSLWLQFRYALMPQIYSIKDMLKFSLAKSPEYRKFRKREIQPVVLEDVNDWRFTGDALLHRRCLIKRAVDANLSFRGILQNYFGGSVLNTIWELKRLSFVWDWFITVGDALKATFASVTGVVGEMSTYSTKLEVTGYYEHPSGARISVTSKCYKRNLINPSSHIGIYFKPEMNWKRQLDSLALFVWPAIRKTLR